VTAQDGAHSRSRLRLMPVGIWVLGIGSLLMDVSSEMIHGLLPVFLVLVLGADATVVGLIEGIAEATVSVTKIFSGTLSDYLGKRKLLVVLGYGIAALTKPLFPLASSVVWILGARFLDRIGKGIREAPRDALIGDITPSGVRGAAYGLRQSLDTVGAFAGPLLAITLMWLTLENYRLVFWIAVIPAFLAVLVLALGIKDPGPVEGRKADGPIRSVDFSRLGAAFWRLVAVAAIFTLARFSEAFLMLRAAQLGLDPALTPFVLIAMNIVYALSAYPAGYLSDRMDRWQMLSLGFGMLILSDATLALWNSVFGVMIGAGLWGLHLGLTQGILAALVADTAAAELRGTAFGIFNLASGVAALLASVAAGLIWDAAGAPATFVASAGVAAFAGLGLVILRRHGDLETEVR
jgi:MFS family permease